MSLTHYLENDFCIISFEGNIPSNEIENLENELQSVLGDRSIINFIISFKNVELLSSAGVATILLFKRLLNERQSKLALCELSTENWEMMSICGLDETVNIYLTMQEAKAALMV